LQLVPADHDQRGAISMPDCDDPALAAAVAELRESGEVVINCLATRPDSRCDRELVELDGSWQVQALTTD
jgi:ATP phosphoribosyltransferase regulatory subunit